MNNTSKRLWKSGWACAMAVVLVDFSGCGRPPAGSAHANGPAREIVARAFQSPISFSSHTYNALSAASDGRIYYVLSSNRLDTGGQMYAYDPRTDKIARLGDLTEAVGEKGLKAVPQGKSHVPFWEFQGKLYFATHAGYYIIRDGREVMAELPSPGYTPYPGGHFVAFDMASGKFSELAKGPAGQGILTMAMDSRRGRLYGITWPNGYFLRYDLASRELKNLGAISSDGEAGSGTTYRALCRAMVADPGDGSVYLTTSDGRILRYRFDRDALETVSGDDLKKDYFGTYDPATPGHMGYNWRQAVWYAPEKAIYAVHGNSGYLFRFDPSRSQVDVLDRITSEPSKRSGMFDKFYYGYLGLALGPDGRTLYYLTGGPMIVDGRRVISRSVARLGAKGEEDLHLVTYEIPTGIYRDHGAVFYPDGGRPSYVNSIAVGGDGSVYALANMTSQGKERTDLIRIRIE